MRKKTKTPRDRMLEDLARSGLTQRDAQKLKYKSTTPTETARLTDDVFDCPAYIIPYPNSDFFRLRLLPDVQPGTGFGKSKKHQRYTQPAGVRTPPYFPESRPWPKIKKDTSEKIVLTEGEKKAACGCKHGLNVIGLGGVWNFRSRLTKESFLAELDDIKWTGRQVFILYDSDLKTNENVQAAMNALAETIIRKGGIPFYVYIPAANGEKIGLDDFIVKHGPEMLEEILDVDEDGNEYCIPANLALDLHKLNESYAYIRHLCKFADFSDDTREPVLMSANELLRHIPGTMDRISPTGKLTQIKKSTVWIDWEERREHPYITYEPGQPPVLDDGALNMWRDHRPHPLRFPKKDINTDKGVGPFLHLLDYMFDAEDKHAKEWFLQWVAYQCLNLGEKIYSSVVVRSSLHGTGKSILGYTLAALHGGIGESYPNGRTHNCIEISDQQLTNSFNEWARFKQFVIGNEVAQPHEMQEVGSIMKDLITRLTVEINSKGIRQYKLRDTINYYLTSNRAVPIPLEKDDRRFFIIDVDSSNQRKRPSIEWFTQVYDPWYRSDEGQGRLLYYFLNYVDMTGFDPKNPAPTTKAKDEMLKLSMHPLTWFIDMMHRDPDYISKIDTASDAYKIKDLLGIMRRHAEEAYRRGNANEQSMGRAWKEYNGVSRTTTIGSLKIIRNAEYWKHASLKELEAHYMEKVENRKPADAVKNRLNKKAGGNITKLDEHRKKP